MFNRYLLGYTSLQKSVNISIFIPTKNRPSFVKRLLDYYQAKRFLGELIVCDASDDSRTGDLVTIANKVALRRIQYRHSQSRPWESVGECLSSSSAGYAALICDDDYLIPDGIEKCISCLALNPTYGSVHGKAVIAYSASSVFKVDAVGNYRMPVRMEETGAQRALNHGLNYGVSLFSVHPIAIFERMCCARFIASVADVCPDWEIYNELLPCFLSVVYGKSIELPDFYLVRQVHNDRYISKGVRDWTATAEFHVSYKYLLTQLTAAIAEVDCCTVFAAAEAARRSFGSYLSRAKRKGSIVNTARLKLRRAIKVQLQANNLLSTVRAARKIVFPKPIDEQVNLSAVLGSDHPYHQDLLSVLHSISYTGSE